MFKKLMYSFVRNSDDYSLPSRTSHVSGDTMCIRFSNALLTHAYVNTYGEQEK